MATESRKMAIAGWVLSVIPALMLIWGGINCFIGSPMVIQGLAHAGYPVTVLKLIGTLELVCSILFLIPRTAFFGAVLLTAYFGGAVASHVRILEGQAVVPVVFGILTWAALCLRDARVRTAVFG